MPKKETPGLSDFLDKDNNTTMTVMKMVKSQPEVAAMLSKMLEAPANQKHVNFLKNPNSVTPELAGLNSVFKHSFDRIRDAENILQMFPDIELAIQIGVSSILSPKDMITVELQYYIDGLDYSSVLTSKILSVINKHMGYYEINKELPLILREAKYTKGSYPKIIIPESVLDSIINNGSRYSAEAIANEFDKVSNTCYGFIGKYDDKQNYSIESALSGTGYQNDIGLFMMDESTNQPVVVDKGVEITDNLDILKIPKFIEQSRRTNVKSIMKNRRRTSTGFESIKVNQDQYQINKLILKANSPSNQSFVIMPGISETKRKSIGRPVILNWPASSLFPIYNPCNPGEHSGYIAMCELTGIPAGTGVDDLGSALGGIEGIMNNSNSTLTGALTEKAKRNLKGQTGDAPTIAGLAALHASIVEDNIIKRAKNGLYDKSLSVSDINSLSLAMLSRSLAGKFTRLVFIPAEYVSYFAFQYFNNGVGRSLLDDMRVITSFRSILMFAKVMSHSKSAINVTRISAELDPRDPDPWKTMELTKHNYAKMRQNYFPVGINDPNDLVKWIQHAGFEFAFSGHEKIPNMKFDTEVRNIQHTMPDQDYDETLRKFNYMHLGLTPEMVDQSTYGVDFATSFNKNNAMFAKRSKQDGDAFSIMTTDYIRKILTADQKFRDDIKKVLQDNKALVDRYLDEDDKIYQSENPESFMDDYIDFIIDHVHTRLPQPDETSIRNLSEAIEEKVRSVDAAIDFYFGNDFINSPIAGEVSEHVDALKALVKATVMRDWIAKNNFVPEIHKLFEKEDGKFKVNLLETNKAHVESIMAIAGNLLESLKEAKKASDKTLDKLTNDEGGGDYGSSGSDDFSSSQTVDQTTQQTGDDFGSMDLQQSIDQTDQIPQQTTDEPVQQTTQQTTEQTNQQAKEE